MREESDKFRDWKTARAREVSALKKDAQRRTYELAKMAGAKQRTENVLKRKMEEIASARQRVKEVTDQLSKIRKQRAGSKQTASSSTKTSLPQKSVQERRQWLEEETRICITVRGLKKSLEKEMADQKLKAAEIGMMEDNLQRLTSRGGSTESIDKITQRVADAKTELKGKEDLIAELQKQLVGTEDVQSSMKRCESVSKMLE